MWFKSMGFSKGKFLKLCENIFAASVIIACIFTLLTSFSSYRLYKMKRTPVHRKNVLRQAKESFQYAMNQLQFNFGSSMTATTMPQEAFMESTPRNTQDQFRDWFKDRRTVKYSAPGKHPILPDTEVINNKDVCKRDSVDILVYFQSRWDHFERRSVLRDTWASSKTFKDINIKAIFILGKPTSKEDQLKINNENLLYHDIVEGDFIDSFANLTMKSILAMKWINENCIQAKYILKADDDMFVNIFALIEYLISQIYDKKKVVMCHAKENNTSPIVRDKNSKWYVPENVFPQRTHFPAFCSGYVVLYTSDLVPELYKASFSNSYFSVDDAYLFGLLMEKIKGALFYDIQDNMTLNQKSALDEYTGDNAIEHVACNAWEGGALEKFWEATLLKLSQWSREHSTVAVLQKSRNDVMGR